MRNQGDEIADKHAQQAPDVKATGCAVEFTTTYDS
jgi:hypothetical protein